MQPIIKPDYEVFLNLGGDQTASFFSQDLEPGKETPVNVPGAAILWTSKEKNQEGIIWREIRFKNSGSEPVLIGAVRLRFTALDRPDTAQWRVFIDAGECAWCGVKKLDALDWIPAFDVIAAQRIKEPEGRSNRFHRSSLQTVLYDAACGEAWLWGFLRQRSGYNGIDIIPSCDDPNHLDRLEAWQLTEKLLRPGEELALDPLVFFGGKDPLDLLERYASLVQAHTGRQFTDPPVVGMMTWYGYRTAIDSDTVLQNATLVSELFDGYPQPMRKLMLLDHGWQTDANWGYWDQADHRRFPQGMQKLGDALRKQGYKLALWYTPFCVTENCPSEQEIYPLLAREAGGELAKSFACVWGQLPGHSNGNWPIYFFDGSLDAVQAKWLDEIRRMADGWGCVYWKLDFFALIADARRQMENPTGDLYARTYRTFRLAAGETAHLAPCSCDTNIQLGYNDSIRIAADIGNAGTWPLEMEAYARGLNTIAALWYKHRRFWVNDPDSIQVGCGCSLNEARVRATAVAFSGGHLMVSEDLRMLSPDRLEIVRRLLPAYGIAARPIDLFEHPYPEDIPHIWHLPVQSDWGTGGALAIFNLSSDVLRIEIQPEWLGLTSGAPFGAVEWWQLRWLGRFDGPFELFIPPADVAVVHAQPYRPHPWLVSVSHHFTGGWIVENLHFDPEAQQLRGILLTRPGISLSLVGTLPEGWMIPSHADYHGRSNGGGGWAYEVKTTKTRTPFSVQFAHRG